MKASTLARVESTLRPLIAYLPPQKAVSIYSQGRQDFLAMLKEEPLPEPLDIPLDLGRTLWGMRFRSPIMNAAGMFKNGECYDLVSCQGTGAYLGGTGTWNQRDGNEKEGIRLPFVPYPRSGAASNWLGLPNLGDLNNIDNVPESKVNGTPIGWSVMASPDYKGEEALEHLVEGMWLYSASGIDFLEINESCPNTEHGKLQESGLAPRLAYIREKFLSKRQRRMPIIVKFSNDTEIARVPELVDMLIDYGFDGVNFGNTSVDYARHRHMIDRKERRLYDYFTSAFKGGVSGRPLKEISLYLAGKAAAHVKRVKPSQEFHVFRTGGIESWQDIEDSERLGISMNQWFTGYFEGFARHGHDVYKKLYSAR